jgi:hypothetical protein
VKYGNFAPFAEKTASSSAYFGAIRVDIPQALTVTALGTYVAQVDAQHTIALGLYRENPNSPGHPGALVVSSTLIVSSTGTKQLAVAPTAIAAGTYFVGATQSNWAHYGMVSAVGSYEHSASSAWSGSAPNPAPATQTFDGSINFFLVAKE